MMLFDLLYYVFYFNQAEDAVVPFVLEQEYDQPYCNDIDNYNLAGQALPCNIHFDCDYCFANKKIIFNEKNGIYHCSICADNSILFGRYVTTKRKVVLF